MRRRLSHRGVGVGAGGWSISCRARRSCLSCGGPLCNCVMRVVVCEGGGEVVDVEVEKYIAPPLHRLSGSKFGSAASAKPDLEFVFSPTIISLTLTSTPNDTTSQPPTPRSPPVANPSHLQWRPRQRVWQRATASTNSATQAPPTSNGTSNKPVPRRTSSPISP